MRSYEEIAEAVFKRRDEYEKKQKERVKMLRKITAAAACVCFVIAIGFVVRYTDIIRDPGVVEPDPTLQTDGTVPTEPPATEPLATEPPATEPSGNGEGIGGHSSLVLSGKYNMAFYGVSATLIKDEEVGTEKFNSWIDQVANENDNVTIYRFIKDFNITKEKFVGLGVAEEYGYTSEQVDALFSDDEAQLIQHFANPCAIIVGEEVYTPGWLLAHSGKEIGSAGLTYEMLEGKNEVWNHYLSPEAVEELNAKTQEVRLYEESI